MNLFVLRERLDAASEPLVRALASLPLTANQWTLLGAVSGLACGLAIWRGLWGLGLFLLLFRGLTDLLDGYKARNYGQRTTFGAIMDDITDRWVLGVIYSGGCLAVSSEYPHALVLLGLGVSGALCNVIAKQSVYTEAPQDTRRVHGKIGHDIDLVGVFGSAEFIIYFGFALLLALALDQPWPLLLGCWAVAVISHVSLAQRVYFCWRRYRHVDPGAPGWPGRRGSGTSR